VVQGVTLSSLFDLSLLNLGLLDKGALYLIFLTSLLLAWYSPFSEVVCTNPFYSLIGLTAWASYSTVDATKVLGTEVDVRMGWAGSSFSRFVL